MAHDLFDPTTAERYRPIGDYGLLSDCHSTALVSCEGSIDWACLRRMDEESTFARILDHDRGGTSGSDPPNGSSNARAATSIRRWCSRRR